MRRDIVASVVAVLAFTVLCGLVYPLAVTGIAQVAFPNKADGSTVMHDGKPVGSKLIGQDFKGEPRYFQSRPSATEYSANATFFNNQGPNQKQLADQLRAAADDYIEQNPGVRRSEIPADAVTTSASGIDPHISVRNARIQARRVARVRGLPLDRVNALIDDNTAGRFLFLGEPGVNVLELNLALDKETQQ
jgi:K+-transporting ATPase ATPase C chain